MHSTAVEGVSLAKRPHSCSNRAILQRSAPETACAAAMRLGRIKSNHIKSLKYSRMRTHACDVALGRPVASRTCIRSRRCRSDGPAAPLERRRCQRRDGRPAQMAPSRHATTQVTGKSNHKSGDTRRAHLRQARPDEEISHCQQVDILRRAAGVTWVQRNNPQNQIKSNHSHQTKSNHTDAPGRCRT